MLRVGHLFEDEALKLSHASVDGVIVHDKVEQLTRVASTHQRQQLEDTLAWLDRLGFPDATSPPLPVRMTYAVFAGAIAHPERAASQEIMADRPEKLAARMMVAAETVTRAPTPQPSRATPDGHFAPWRRATIVACGVGFSAMILATLAAFVWEGGRLGRVGDLLAGDHLHYGIGSIFASTLRRIFWIGLCIGLQHWASFRGDRRPITSHP